MNRKGLQIAMGLEWLAIAVVALRYGSVWEQLPGSMATHFNAAGQPNGWMPRDSSLGLIVAVLAIVLGISQAIVWAARKSGTNAVAWGLLGFSYFVAVFIVMANEKVIQYNLHGEPVQLSAFLLAIPFAVVALIAAILVSHSGSELPAGKVIAEEVHDSHAWGSVFVVLGLLAVGGLTKLGEGAVRVPLAIVAFVFLAVGLAAWSGFHYSFTQYGVVVRALGFRVKSIPASQIQRYAIDSWNALRGYGIRGVGNCRAYVWGDKGIWITTASERVFLGHSQPERLVRDMDRMMKFVKT